MALSLDGTTGLSASGNITGGNINSTGAISVAGSLSVGTFSPSSISSAGNITGNYIIGNGSQLTGLPAGYTNANLASLGANAISTTGTITGGNITGGNIITSGSSGDISGTGNITGNYIIGNGSQLTGLPAGYTNANLASLGSNNVSTTGTVTSSSVVGGVITGSSTSVTGTTTAASVVGGVITGSSTSVTGTTTAASVVGGVITGTSLSASGNITGGNVNTGGNVTGAWVLPTTGVSTGGNILVGGYISVVGNLYVANIVSSQTLTVDDPLLYLTANTPYPYNYDIGFYSAFTGGGGNTYQHTGLVRDYTDNTWKLVSNVPEPAGSAFDFDNAIYDPLKTGAITASTGAFSSTISATGAITGASVVGGVMTGTSLSVTGAVNGASVVGGVMTGTSLSVTGAVNGAGITGTSLTVGTGTITGGNIVNSNANGVGNIGSSTTYFNTVFAKATSAQYADLAEMYCADAEYAPGTVLDFGGNQEVTATTQSHSTKVAGIVSTNPSYLMNSALDCTNAVEVALVGRVPCRVVGTIAKGDRLVASSIAGVATRLDMSQYQPGCIIGKALEAYDSETAGTIEVAVGRF